MTYKTANIQALSGLARTQVEEFPRILTPSIQVIGIVMPVVRQLTTDNGYSVYKYTATIRELTREI